MLHCSGFPSGTFNIPAGWIFFYSYASCQVRMANRQTSNSMTYCYDDFRGTTFYIAFNCQATQNAYAGYCLMNNTFAIGE